MWLSSGTDPMWLGGFTALEMPETAPWGGWELLGAARSHECSSAGWTWKSQPCLPPALLDGKTLQRGQQYLHLQKRHRERAGVCIPVLQGMYLMLPTMGPYQQKEQQTEHINHGNGVLPASWLLVATSPGAESFRNKANTAFEISFLPQLPKTHCHSILPCPSYGSHCSRASWSSALCFTLCSSSDARTTTLPIRPSPHHFHKAAF